MNAEIIAIGTEITSGAKLDTNSQWLSLQLAEMGIETRFHTTVADDLDANIDVVRIACERVDLVLITGGLGPTMDDLTREAIAGAAKVGLELDSASLENIEKFFRSRGREMPVRNRIQALFPAGSIPLPNPIGTAPGIWMELIRDEQPLCTIVAMPGVPSEMKRMYFEQVRPRLPAGQKVIRRARMNCFGLGESNIEELLGDLTERGHDPEIGITAHDATITLRIIAQGASEQECADKITTASSQIQEKLGNYVFGVEDEELQHIVVRFLNARNLSFASIECGTCGELAERISHVEGAASCYRGGLVVPAMTDSPAVLAERQRAATGADYVLYIGPENYVADIDSHPVSSIPMGLMNCNGTLQQLDLKWSGNPDITRSRATKQALDLLRQELMHCQS